MCYLPVRVRVRVIEREQSERESGRERAQATALALAMSTLAFEFEFLTIAFWRWSQDYCHVVSWQHNWKNADRAPQLRYSRATILNFAVCFYSFSLYGSCLRSLQRSEATLRLQHNSNRRPHRSQDPRGRSSSDVRSADLTNIFLFRK